MAKEKKNTDKDTTTQFPPVVSVVGHVDHGKTTLLDALRKSNIATREAGGITQGIGASQIEVKHDNKKRKITFIDTPGHEAFMNMRAQGVSASDIALLVVAADDAVKPQTKESIEKIKEANIPYIVVFTKIDTPGANIQKAKGEILKETILLEGHGGDIPYVAVSAPKNKNIQDLIDVILLVNDMSENKKSTSVEFVGIVIDSKRDKRKGITNSIVVKNGILRVKDDLFTQDENIGKVRAMFDTNGKGVKEAKPGDAVEIIGCAKIVDAGSLLFKNEQIQKEQEPTSQTRTPQDLLKLFQEEKGQLAIILKSGTSAEMEAIKNSLPEEVKIVHEGQGEITTSDVLLAKDFDALVIAFNTKIARDAMQLAQSEKIFYKEYTIIYELLNELQDALNSLTEDKGKKLRGKAEILAKFPSDDGDILGLRVTEGRLALNDDLQITRGDNIIGEGKVVSLKRGKKEVKEVAKGLECGSKISPDIDFQVGDMVSSYK